MVLLGINDLYAKEIKHVGVLICVGDIREKIGIQLSSETIIMKRRKSYR